MKKNILILSIILLLCVSCKQKSSTNSQVDISSSSVGFGMEEVRSKDKFYVDESNYEVYGFLRPGYEFGFDDNNHAFLTDVRTSVQIIFMCEDDNWYYSKEEFLRIYKKSIEENVDAGEGLARVIVKIRKGCEKEEFLWSYHFKKNITRCFVDYRSVYKYFHI